MPIMMTLLCIISLGLKFDCSSGWEVERSIAAGVPPESLSLR